MSICWFSLNFFPTIGEMEIFFPFFNVKNASPSVKSSKMCKFTQKEERNGKSETQEIIHLIYVSTLF